MNYITVDDINIQDLEIYHQLRETAFRSDNSFIADSPKVVNMLLQSDIEVKSILATQKYYDEFKELIASKKRLKLYLALKSQMQSIVGHKIHHECMMHGIRPDSVSLEDLGNEIVMLEEISSTENVGSIARSAAAMGIDSYMVSKKSPHPFSRRALRVSMGHASLLKTHIFDDTAQSIQELKSLGYKIFAAEIKEGATDLSNVKAPKKWVIVMGHEGKGVSQDLLSLCDEIVKIEMQEGIKSLNVSVAASIIMYSFKQKLS